MTLLVAGDLLVVVLGLVVVVSLVSFRAARVRWPVRSWLDEIAAMS